MAPPRRMFSRQCPIFNLLCTIILLRSCGELNAQHHSRSRNTFKLLLTCGTMLPATRIPSSFMTPTARLHCSASHVTSTKTVAIIGSTMSHSEDRRLTINGTPKVGSYPVCGYIAGLGLTESHAHCTFGFGYRKIPSTMRTSMRTQSPFKGAFQR